VVIIIFSVLEISSFPIVREKYNYLFDINILDYFSLLAKKTVQLKRIWKPRLNQRVNLWSILSVSIMFSCGHPKTNL